MSRPPPQNTSGRGIVTIGDVAELAGVSTATVSRVLSGRSRGRGDSRERVLSAARALDYRPSSVARSLKLRTTHTLGLLITDIQNPFFPELVRAIEDRARDRGYAVLLGNGANDPEREGRIPGAARITPGRRRAGGHERPAASPRPVARSCSPADGAGQQRDPGRDHARRDERQPGGGRMAAEHLLGLGHRRLGMVTVSLDDPGGGRTTRRCPACPSLTGGTSGDPGHRAL